MSPAVDVPIHFFGILKAIKEKSPAWTSSGEIWVFWPVWVLAGWGVAWARRILGHELTHVWDGIQGGPPKDAPEGHHAAAHGCLRVGTTPPRRTWDHSPVVDLNVTQLLRDRRVFFGA